MEKIIVTDRSAAELDDKCGMARWWNRHEGGRGIVPKVTAEALTIGTEIHNDLEWAASTWDGSTDHLSVHLREMDELMTTRDSMTALERHYRRMGWLAAYCLYVEPKIRQDYDPVSTEAEITIERSPVWTGLIPDRVLRRKSDGKLVYREYKSVKDPSYRWIEHWRYDIQLHAGIKALEEELGEKVAFAQVMGLVKGREYNGRLVHPYVWAHHSPSKGWETDGDKARGGDWCPLPVWEYDEDILSWVLKLGPDVAKAQFPHTGPIFLNPRMAEDWLQTRRVREMKIDEVKAECQKSWELRVVHFPPRTQNCRPVNADPCPYLSCCWNATVQADPLGKGEYLERQPHHELELINLEV